MISRVLPGPLRTGVIRALFCGIFSVCQNSQGCGCCCRLAVGHG